MKKEELGYKKLATDSNKREEEPLRVEYYTKVKPVGEEKVLEMEINSKDNLLKALKFQGKQTPRKRNLTKIAWTQTCQESQLSLAI